MKVVGTGGLNPGPLAEGPSPGKGRSARGSADKAAATGRDARPLPVGAGYVRAAMASEEIDRQAVVEARKLLESGLLDTPEAALRAARALLERGI